MLTVKRETSQFWFESHREVWVIEGSRYRDSTVKHKLLEASPVLFPNNQEIIFFKMRGLPFFFSIADVALRCPPKFYRSISRDEVHHTNVYSHWISLSILSLSLRVSSFEQQHFAFSSWVWKYILVETSVQDVPFKDTFAILDFFFQFKSWNLHWSRTRVFCQYSALVEFAVSELLIISL